MREEAKRRAELYQALADGKTLQIREVINGGEERWSDVDYPIALFLIDKREGDKFRIKPEPKKQSYRVGLYQNTLGNFVPVIMISKDSEIELEKSSSFVRWLTDRTEYELPEVEA